jgi:tRNA(Arg) A34 adenosine deaminase TadA
VLVGAVQTVDGLVPGSSAWSELETTHALRKFVDQHSLKTVLVPSRPPQSEEEWKLFNNSVWPTVYLPNRTLEFEQNERRLSEDEIEQMAVGLEAAVLDSQRYASVFQLSGGNHIDSSAWNGAVIVSPESGDIVSASFDEFCLQSGFDGTTAPPFPGNPLATPIVWAIQGVSRKERTVAMKEGLSSAAFQKGQYLCTGYDVYTLAEPTVFEAMALVHARVHRVVYGVPQLEMGEIYQSCMSHDVSPGETERLTLSSPLGGLKEVRVHALPGTNHRYRAFECVPESALGKKCRQLIRELLGRVRIQEGAVASSASVCAFEQG